jgi:hypothetical protein
MGIVLMISAVCAIFGAVAVLATRGPLPAPDIASAIKSAEVKRFSPTRTLFVIGPGANQHACRMQRRLLKPAIPTLILRDVSVIEVYGMTRPRRNGDPMEWLDASLLRHAMDAEEGFFVIFVDDAGRTVFRNEAPMLARDILKKAGLASDAGGGQDKGPPQKPSLVLKKLRAA